jgi:hypothetical protein
MPRAYVERRKRSAHLQQWMPRPTRPEIVKELRSAFVSPLVGEAFYRNKNSAMSYPGGPSYGSGNYLSTNANPQGTSSYTNTQTYTTTNPVYGTLQPSYGTSNYTGAPNYSTNTSANYLNTQSGVTTTPASSYATSTVSPASQTSYGTTATNYTAPSGGTQYQTNTYATQTGTTQYHTSTPSYAGQSTTPSYATQTATPSYATQTAPSYATPTRTQDTSYRPNPSPSAVTYATAEGSFHTYNDNEKQRFVEYINSILSGDPDLQGIIPINPVGDDIFRLVGTTSLLWYGPSCTSLTFQVKW